MFALSQPDKKEIPLTNLESWICLDFISNLVFKFLEHFFSMKLTFICLHQLCIDYLASATVLTYCMLSRISFEQGPWKQKRNHHPIFHMMFTFISLYSHKCHDLHKRTWTLHHHRHKILSEEKCLDMTWSFLVAASQFTSSRNVEDRQKGSS